jgi:hypothetical protein
LLALAGAAGLFCGGRALGMAQAQKALRQSAESAGPVEGWAERSAGATTAVAALDALAVKEQLRQLLREEIPALMKQEGSAAPAPAEPQPVVAPTPEQTTSGERAETLVQASISNGQWTERDRELWQELGPRLGPEKHGELLRTLIVALNSRRITLATEGPPF